MTFNNFLNFLRWIAAFMVVIGHLRSFLFVNYYEVLHHDIFTKVFYFITGFGHQGVVVFFVISGYLVGGGMLQKYRQNSLDNQYLKLYFIKRFSRIYIVLIPALSIGFILDNIGIRYFQELYNNIYHISAMNFNVQSSLNLNILFGNIFNLQTILVEPLGSNGLLWSLANEWWYYILLPLLLVSIKSRIIFVILVFGLLFLNSSLLVYACLWLFGAIIFQVNKKILHLYISFSLLFGILIISRKFTGIYSDFTLAFTLVLVINSVKFSNIKVNLFNNFNGQMANFSYSLYLFHFPFFVFIISCIHYTGIDILSLQPTLKTFGIYFMILSSIYIYSYVIYLLFEKHTYKFKSYLIRLFNL